MYDKDEGNNMENSTSDLLPVPTEDIALLLCIQAIATRTPIPTHSNQMRTLSSRSRATTLVGFGETSVKFKRVIGGWVLRRITSHPCMKTPPTSSVFPSCAISRAGEILGSFCQTIASHLRQSAAEAQKSCDNNKDSMLANLLDTHIAYHVFCTLYNYIESLGVLRVGTEEEDKRTNKGDITPEAASETTGRSRNASDYYSEGPHFSATSHFNSCRLASSETSAPFMLFLQKRMRALDTMQYMSHSLHSVDYVAVSHMPCLISKYCRWVRVRWEVALFDQQIHVLQSVQRDFSYCLYFPQKNGEVGHGKFALRGTLSLLTSYINDTRISLMSWQKGLQRSSFQSQGVSGENSACGEGSTFSTSKKRVNVSVEANSSMSSRSNLRRREPEIVSTANKIGGFGVSESVQKEESSEMEKGKQRASYMCFPFFSCCSVAKGSHPNPTCHPIVTPSCEGNITHFLSEHFYDYDRNVVLEDVSGAGDYRGNEGTSDSARATPFSSTSPPHFHTRKEQLTGAAFISSTSLATTRDTPSYDLPMYLTATSHCQRHTSFYLKNDCNPEAALAAAETAIAAVHNAIGGPFIITVAHLHRCMSLIAAGKLARACEDLTLLLDATNGIDAALRSGAAICGCVLSTVCLALGGMSDSTVIDGDGQGGNDGELGGTSSATSSTGTMAFTPAQVRLFAQLRMTALFLLAELLIHSPTVVPVFLRKGLIEKMITLSSTNGGKGPRTNSVIKQGAGASAVVRGDLSGGGSSFSSHTIVTSPLAAIRLALQIPLYLPFSEQLRCSSRVIAADLISRLGVMVDGLLDVSKHLFTPLWGMDTYSGSLLKTSGTILSAAVPAKMRIALLQCDQEAVSYCLVSALVKRTRSTSAPSRNGIPSSCVLQTAAAAMLASSIPSNSVKRLLVAATLLDVARTLDDRGFIRASMDCSVAALRVCRLDLTELYKEYCEWGRLYREKYGMMRREKRDGDEVGDQYVPLCEVCAMASPNQQSKNHTQPTRGGLSDYFLREFTKSMKAIADKDGLVCSHPNNVSAGYFTSDHNNNEFPPRSTRLLHDGMIISSGQTTLNDCDAGKAKHQSGELKLQQNERICSRCHCEILSSEDMASNRNAERSRATSLEMLCKEAIIGVRSVQGSHFTKKRELFTSPNCGGQEQGNIGLPFIPSPMGLLLASEALYHSGMCALQLRQVTPARESGVTEKKNKKGESGNGSSGNCKTLSLSSSFSLFTPCVDSTLCDLFSSSSTTQIPPLWLVDVVTHMLQLFHTEFHHIRAGVLRSTLMAQHAVVSITPTATSNGAVVGYGLHNVTNAMRLCKEVLDVCSNAGMMSSLVELLIAMGGLVLMTGREKCDKIAAAFEKMLKEVIDLLGFYSTGEVSFIGSGNDLLTESQQLRLNWLVERWTRTSGANKLSHLSPRQAATSTGKTLLSHIRLTDKIVFTAKQLKSLRNHPLGNNTSSIAQQDKEQHLLDDLRRLQVVLNMRREQTTTDVLVRYLCDHVGEGVANGKGGSHIVGNDITTDIPLILRSAPGMLCVAASTAGNFE